MSARKKSSKSSSKKQQGSSTKPKISPLINLLQQRISQRHQAVDNVNLTALILQSLLQKNVSKLDNLLSQWSQDPQAIKNVISNIVESKISLFVSKISQILKQHQNKDYVYPWLAQIFTIHPNKISESIGDRLQSLCEVKREDIKQLMKIKGKLNLILQQ